MALRSLAEAFTDRFGRPCAAIASAPGRVNLIGEHTDYNDGFVLPMALEQRTQVAVAPRDDQQIRAAAIDLNEECTWPLTDWNAESYPHWTSYIAGIAALLRRRGAHLAGADILIRSAVPVGSGLSSSAALGVATAKALIQLSGEAIGTTEVADLCRAAEHEFAGVPCGIMDPFISLLGQADTALLLDCRSRTWQHIPLRLDGHTVVIVNSGVRHELAAGEYALRQKQCAAAVAYFQRLNPSVRALRDVDVALVRAHALQLDPLAAARALHVTTENARTFQAAEALRRGDLATLGRLMAESHRSLRDDYEVSCRELNQLVNIVSRVAGVVGARMTGAGFGGCIVAIARSDALPLIEAAVRAQYDAAGFGPARVWTSRPGPGAAVDFG